MDWLQLAAFAFLAGLTACGTAASLWELFARREVRFAEPFVSGEHLRKSVLATVTAGPFMLVNDALSAWRDRGISSCTLAICGVAAVLWTTAAGLVVLVMASGVAGLLAP